MTTLSPLTAECATDRGADASGLPLYRDGNGKAASAPPPIAWPLIDQMNPDAATGRRAARLTLI